MSIGTSTSQSWAAKNLPKDGAGATVVADSGGDYVNQEVDSLLGLG
jgi:hypothetical protein